MAVVVLTVGAVVAIAAHAPSTTHLHAQLQQIGAVVGSTDSGQWFLPVAQQGGLARKPQLYAWLAGPALLLSGRYDDFTFRLPTVAASFATAVLVYFLGRRWYGRRAGLLAPVLWATMLHMGKMAYLATTDMLLTCWITAAVLCADRLLFHPAGRTRRRRWAAGFWAAMVLAGMSKGWGAVNLVLVGLTVALAAATWRGFGALRAVEGAGRKALLAGRLVARRWLAAARALGLWWGLPLMAAAIVPVWVAMFRIGGEDFAEVVRYEFWGRLTGSGATAPHSRSTPAVANLLYYAAPATIFAVGALVLVHPRRWLTRRGPAALPLAWVLATVLPFSLAHGFRPAYLLPCYGAVALMGAWAVEELARRGRQAVGTAAVLRHVFAAVPILTGLAGSAIALGYLVRDRLPGPLAGILEAPFHVEPETRIIAAVLVGAGLAVAAAAIWASLAWRIRTLAGLAAAGMIGMVFLNTHFIAQATRDGDGEKMRRFAAAARSVVGRDEFFALEVQKLLVELYLGRFGTPVEAPARLAEALASRPHRWLFTCDKGLVAAGAAAADPNGPYVLGKRLRFHTMPEQLGHVRLTSPPIAKQRWGQMYLIELRRPVRITGKPTSLPFVSGKPDEDAED